MKYGPYPTDRLELREYELSDLENSHLLASDPDVVRFVKFDPNDEEASRAFVAREAAARSQAERGTIRLVIDLPGEGLIGDTVLIRGPKEDRSAELGCYVRKPFWGMGYAAEAASAMIDFGFRELNLNRIWSRCVAEHAASARVMEKIGMTREGVLRESMYIKGQLADWIYSSILRREWEAGQAAVGS